MSWSIDCREAEAVDEIDDDGSSGWAFAMTRNAQARDASFDKDGEAALGVGLCTLCRWLYGC